MPDQQFYTPDWWNEYWKRKRQKHFLSKAMCLIRGFLFF